MKRTIAQAAKKIAQNKAGFTWEDLENFFREEHKLQKEKDYIIYVGAETWEAALEDINHPYHYIIKNQIKNGETKS